MPGSALSLRSPFPRNLGVGDSTKRICDRPLVDDGVHSCWRLLILAADAWSRLLLRTPSSIAPKQLAMWGPSSTHSLIGDVAAVGSDADEGVAREGVSPWKDMVAREGVEPPTPAFSGLR